MSIVLKDGTELPALPEGCFETRPYGFVTKIENDGTLLGCVLYTGFDIADYVETELSGQTTCSLVCHATNFVSYEYEVGSDTTWKDGVEDTSGDGLMAMVGANGAFTIDVAWTNFDIFYLDHVDDDGDRVLSDTLYHRSDVNYRIYGGWLNSMGNQARRLGNVSGALKPGEMEGVFSGATLEPLTVTPTSEEQTFTPESPCIGFSVVTVEAAPDTGGGDIVEPDPTPEIDETGLLVYTLECDSQTGTTLLAVPPIPADILSEYPYSILVVEFNTAGYYRVYLYTSTAPFYSEYSKMYKGDSARTPYYQWDSGKGLTEWGDQYGTFTTVSYSANSSGKKLLWSGHDILLYSDKTTLVHSASKNEPFSLAKVTVPTT